MTPSTYFSSTRFGVPTGPVFNPPRSLAMPPSSTKSNAADFITSSSEDDDMDFVSTNETVKRAPSATVVSPIRTDFYAQSYQQHQISSASSTPSPMSVTKTSTSSDFSMDTYSIPIQPRKHVSSVKTSQAAPVETGRFVSTLASEMNAARIVGFFINHISNSSLMYGMYRLQISSVQCPHLDSLPRPHRRLLRIGTIYAPKLDQRPKRTSLNHNSQSLEWACLTELTKT